VAHDVERVLANIDADHDDGALELLGHGVLLVCGAPCQLRLPAGQEHGRTIPLTDFAPHWLSELGASPAQQGPLSSAAWDKGRL
jgi:hypothetical protein